MHDKGFGVRRLHVGGLSKVGQALSPAALASVFLLPY